MIDLEIRASLRQSLLPHVDLRKDHVRPKVVGIGVDRLAQMLLGFGGVAHRRRHTRGQGKHAGVVGRLGEPLVNPRLCRGGLLVREVEHHQPRERFEVLGVQRLGGLELAPRQSRVLVLQRDGAGQRVHHGCRRVLRAHGRDDRPGAGRVAVGEEGARKIELDHRVVRQRLGGILRELQRRLAFALCQVELGQLQLGGRHRGIELQDLVELRDRLVHEALRSE